MKSLEADAMKAEAVIARAQELNKNNAAELAFAGKSYHVTSLSDIVIITQDIFNRICKSRFFFLTGFSV